MQTAGDTVTVRRLPVQARDHTEERDAARAAKLGAFV